MPVVGSLKAFLLVHKHKLHHERSHWLYGLKEVNGRHWSRLDFQLLFGEERRPDSRARQKSSLSLVALYGKMFCLARKRNATRFCPSIRHVLTELLKCGTPYH